MPHASKSAVVDFILRMASPTANKAASVCSSQWRATDGASGIAVWASGDLRMLARSSPVRLATPNAAMPHSRVTLLSGLMPSEELDSVIDNEDWQAADTTDSFPRGAAFTTQTAVRDDSSQRPSEWGEGV